MLFPQAIAARLFAAAFLALCSCCVLAEEPSPSLRNADALPSAPSPASAPAPAGEEKAVLSTAIGISYQQNNFTNVPGSGPAYLLGWWGVEQYHIDKHFAVLVDFVNFQNLHRNQHETAHVFFGGVSYNLRDFGRFTPFVAAEGGAIRDSKQGSVSYIPAALGGVGFNYKLTHALALQVIPFQYVATIPATGGFQSNYNTKVGLVFTSFRRKHPSV